MTEDMKQYLRDNLTVAVRIKGMSFSSHKVVEVQLLLDGEVISESQDDLPGGYEE